VASSHFRWATVQPHRRVKCGMLEQICGLASSLWPNEEALAPEPRHCASTAYSGRLVRRGVHRLQRLNRTFDGFSGLCCLGRCFSLADPGDPGDSAALGTIAVIFRQRFGRHHVQAIGPRSSFSVSFSVLPDHLIYLFFLFFFFQFSFFPPRLYPSKQVRGRWQLQCLSCEFFTCPSSHRPSRYCWC
jgi:hypothetical protein